MENNIAVITVPLNEWKDLKNQMQNIAKSLLEIKSQEKSEFLTPKEVCELLKCSRNTFQSYIDKGFLEPIRMKSQKYSKVLIKRVDVEYYLQSRIENQ